MKKRGKKYMALFLCASMSVLSAIPAFAAEKLRTPSWVKWGETPGEITYEEVPEAEGEYKYQVYKDGEPYYSTTNINQKGSHPYYYDITESGEYTFQVSAVGDGVNTENSDPSAMSGVFSYSKPEKVFGEPQNMRWSSTDKGVAMWEPPTGSGNYKDVLRYRLKLYEGGPEGNRVVTIYGIKDNSRDLSKYMTSEVNYVFSVQSLSEDITKIYHGNEAFCNGEVDVPDENEEILGKLEDINSSYASPSDAAKELKKIEINELAIAMQSNEEALGAVKSLEDKYLNDLGASVETAVSQDVDLRGEDIELVGAGLNIASGSNAVKFQVKKPDQEAKVDKSLYKNTLQVDFSLAGVVSQLFVPVRITMPIPEGVKPDRLVILHHHKDGSYEIVPLLKNGDGTVSFTVTSFSVFTFAEKVEEAEDPDDPDDSGKTEGSKGSGGGRAASIRDYNTPGTWEKDGSGWKYKKQDGTYPAQSWIMIQNQWYRFDEFGYMKTGWVLDQGKWYYLNPQTGAQEGSMLLGWQLIQGKWYFFNPLSNGMKGAMYANTVTPDGYVVGNDGSWVN